MNAETKKEVLVEYPIDTVYNVLLSLFPVKYYKLQEYDLISHSFVVIDSFNPTFEMEIDLNENTPDTTIIIFMANYPHAIMDLTEGGKQAIEMVLEELLIQLDKQPRTSSLKAQDYDIEVVNADNFVNTTKNKTHTLSIVVGYILCFLSFVLPVISLINYNPDDVVMVMFFIGGIVCLSIEISLSIILQYYEDSKSKLHGKIQICMCGLVFFILGIIIHPGLMFAAILIPLVALLYFFKRSKSIE